MKLAALLLAALAATLAIAHHPGQTRAATPPAGRIAVLVLENRSYEQIIGNPQVPYINSLARSGALATRYFAITHPSLPNYVALTTGGHTGITTDCAVCQAEGKSIVNQLDAAKISWRGYFENRPPQIKAPFTPHAKYNRHYNPFVYDETLSNADLGRDIGSFARLRADLAARRLPRFSWIAPNVLHDGHNSRLPSVDRYAATLVPSILRALGPHGVLFLTWDEGQKTDTRGANGRGGGHVPLIALGPGARPGARVSTPANHYALLKTIETMLRLSHLGHARGAQTPVLTGLLRTG